MKKKKNITISIDPILYQLIDENFDNKSRLIEWFIIEGLYKNKKYRNKIEKIKAEDLTKNHFVVYPKNKKSIEIHSDMMIEFFGYYIAEGCRTASNKGVKFTLHENEVDFANSILYLGREIYGLIGKVKPKKRKAISVEFYNKSL